MRLLIGILITAWLVGLVAWALLLVLVAELRSTLKALIARVIDLEAAQDEHVALHERTTDALEAQHRIVNAILGWVGKSSDSPVKIRSRGAS